MCNQYIQQQQYIVYLNCIQYMLDQFYIQNFVVLYTVYSSGCEIAIRGKSEANKEPSKQERNEIIFYIPSTDWVYSAEIILKAATPTLSYVNAGGKRFSPCLFNFNPTFNSVVSLRHGSCRISNQFYHGGNGNSRPNLPLNYRNRQCPRDLL